MKRLNLIIVFCVSITFILATSSCNTYRSLHTATKISQLSANPFYQKVAKSLISNISSQVISKGLTSFKGSPKLLSPINAIFNTPQSVTAFKDMISSSYGIGMNKIEQSFSNWRTIKDAISFVARNGKNYDFRYSNAKFL